MNVVVSAGGRFHAHRLAQQLHKKNSLAQLFTFDYTEKDTAIVPASLVTKIKSCAYLNQLYSSLQLYRIINKSHFNVFKDNLFDYLVDKKLKNVPHIDIFVGWAHYASTCIQELKKQGTIVIIESGSSHIVEQQNILQQEYTRYNIPYTPIAQQTIDKMTKEYKLADYIMTLSTFSRDSFIRHGIPESKILKIPCGVDTTFFSTEPTTAKAKKFRVIFVGLVTLRKGIHLLIQAWQKAKLPTNDTELVIVGAIQKDFLLIKNQLPITPNILFTGPVDRQTLKTLYQSASVFVLPSLEDGFGMVIGEAMASGLPIICSTHTAGPEMITNGKEGFLYDPYDTAKLANLLTWFYEHPTEAMLMGNEGKKNVEQFSWDIYGNRIYTTYQQLLQKKVFGS